MMTTDFSGTGVALVTPFKQDLSIDYPALERLIDYVIKNGVNYLVALGTTAETPTLSAEEKESILSFILERAAGRVPVVCGAGGNNTAEVIAQMKAYSGYDIAAWLSVAPYYNKPSQEGIYRHFKAIAESTDKPVILYNVPGRTVTNILPKTALRLAAEFAHIVAIKEASGSLPQCMELVSGSPDSFLVLSGDDNLILSQAAIGMKGVISVAANCFTKDFTGVMKAALDGRFGEVRQAFYRLLPAIDLLFAEGNPTGVKYVLHKMGILENVLRLPLVPAGMELQAAIDKMLLTLEL